MTQSACSADRGGDGPQSTQGGSGTSTSPDTHLSLDGGWDSALSLAGVARLDLANMDGTEPLKHAQNVRELRLERVSGSMEVSRALARLTIVDSPIACTNPQGRDLPNLAEVAVSSTFQGGYYSCLGSHGWLHLVHVLQRANQLRCLTLDCDGSDYEYPPYMTQLKQLEMLVLTRIRGSVYLSHSIRSITLTNCKITNFQCDVDSLPDLRELTIVDINKEQTFLSKILERAHGLRNLTLQYVGIYYSKYQVQILDISMLKFLETLVVTEINVDLYLPQTIRSITLKDCNITNFQCDAKLLPDLQEFIWDEVSNGYNYVSSILQKTKQLRKLTLKSNGGYSKYLPDISEIKQLEILVLTHISGNIYLSPCIRIVILKNCRIDKLYYSSNYLPDLLELTIINIAHDQTFLGNLLEKAKQLRNLTLMGNSIYYSHTPCMSYMKQLEVLVLDRMSGDIYLSPNIRSITITDCAIHSIQFSAESLSQLQELTLCSVKYDKTILSQILQNAHRLQKFKLKDNGILQYGPPDISSLTQLKMVKFSNIYGDIYLPSCIESFTLNNCKIKKVQIDAESLPHLQEFTIIEVSYYQNFVNKILQKSHGLRNLTMKSKDNNQKYPLDMSMLQQLEIIMLDRIRDNINFPPSIRTVTLKDCTITDFQCNAESLSALWEFTLLDVSCDQSQLNNLLQKMHSLRHLTLERGGRSSSNYKFYLLKIFSGKYLETLCLEQMICTIYISSTIRSIFLTQCTIHGVQCSSDQILNLRKLSMINVNAPKTALRNVLQKANRLQSLVVHGYYRKSYTIAQLYLQPSVLVLDLENVNVNQLVLTAAPRIEKLRLHHIIVKKNYMPEISRLIKAKTATLLDVSDINVDVGTLADPNLAQFALSTFIQRAGMDVKLNLTVGCHYYQRGNMMYQNDDNTPAALPTSLTIFLLQLKIRQLSSELVVLGMALAE
ncbi:hypothetical protein SS50377_25207 [Spironucleus salmonicida]|uniref:F-box/LRR-repeat protein 15/At3g58940/PEG3-like LRR domain-containing protein n=1 Tax=Spironucleus salmonicida TaxID=348837 RepID=V6LNK8_9EUKA|nr:hypothetical protein SS50377_25207 [Spironucleus salmonicida]|eukprot:EST46257.1 hypothetical protein SS50377_13729 [Spironucleus salmonicida]